MQVNLNPNSVMNYGCSYGFRVPGANRIVKKLGPEFEEAISETIPTLQLLNNRAKVKIKIFKGKEVNSNGFSIEVSPFAKSGLKRLFGGAKENTVLKKTVLANDEQKKGKKFSEIMIDTIIDMVNSVSEHQV